MRQLNTTGRMPKLKKRVTSNTFQWTEDVVVWGNGELGPRNPTVLVAHLRNRSRTAYMETK